MIMTGSSWIEISAEFPQEPADWSLAAGILADCGVTSSRVESQPPRIISCVAKVNGYEEAVEAIKESLKNIGAVRFTYLEIPELDWIATFKDHFKAQKLGKKLAIIPTWDQDTLFSNRIVIRLDPGQAFGTGDHPTTRMCLELLEEVKLDGKSVLDLGCGSGILSIAAKKLGAKSVLGSDIEPISVEIARENATNNNESIELMCSAGLDLIKERKFDVIISNIISATLIRLAPQIKECLVDKGAWIVSGIIESNWNDVEKVANQCGFMLIKKIVEGDWMAGHFSLGNSQVFDTE